MIIKETPLNGCLVIEPRVFYDERGYFFESFNDKKLEDALGLKVNFVQDNQSFSTRGVLRGLHYQEGKFAQAKLVRVLSGEVLDVALDLRKESATCGKYFSIVLSSENKKQLYIPRGFAHGFVVLSERAEFFYKCDNYYNKVAERGVLYNDSQLGIDWGIRREELIISEKDLLLPKLKDLVLS